MNEIVLGGCTPEPLMGYLKALGVLRIIAEQIEANVRGCWKDSIFVLLSDTTHEELIDFFLNVYKPTPVIVPWSGGDYFNVSVESTINPYSKTPTSSKVIESFLATSSDRLAEYRTAIKCALSSLSLCGIFGKKDMENKERKRSYIGALRNFSPGPVVDWIDACAALTSEKAAFNVLLGSGGGSDGNTHFSDNFMQNLWEVLPDFDLQRKKQKGSSRTLLENALWGINTSQLVKERTSSLYDAGATGGANAGQGFERIAFANPWNFILCLEGTLLFAGAISRRQAAGEMGQAAFPFQARLTSTSLDSSAEKETEGREVWLPLWGKWANLSEIKTIFTEGRMSIGTKKANRGVDFARAVASLGIDRGIRAFQRYAIVKGRIGGVNYNTSAHLGCFDVNFRSHVDLIREIDEWLDPFRFAASDGKVPPRFKSALRQIESSIFAFCQYGGVSRFTDIMCALGRAERELVNGEKFRTDKKLSPLAGLSSKWLEAAYDCSAEFEIALALAGIYDSANRIGSLRTNLEPVRSLNGKQSNAYVAWTKEDRDVVWNSANLVRNLAAVLERRLMDGKREGCERLPIAYRRTASLNAVAAFLAGETDDERIAELLWGLILIDHGQTYPTLVRRTIDSPPLPRSYALLKLLFQPRPLKTVAGDIEVKPEMSILPLLRAKRPAEAWDIAIRRLRVSGLIPMAVGTYREQQWFALDTERLAAALLIPISQQDTALLMNMVIRPYTLIENVNG